jgi:hypothetical protein
MPRRSFTPSQVQGVNWELKQLRAASVPPEASFREPDSLQFLAAKRLTRRLNCLSLRPHTALGNTNGKRHSDEEQSDEEPQSQEFCRFGEYGAARATNVVCQARLRSAPLRRLAEDLSKISKRRAILEKDLRHVGLPLVKAALIEDLKSEAQKHSLIAFAVGANKTTHSTGKRTRYSVRPTNSKAQASDVLSEFPIALSSAGTGPFLLPISLHQ